MGTESLNRDSPGIVDAPLADSEVCGGVKEKIRGILWELRPKIFRRSQNSISVADSWEIFGWDCRSGLWVAERTQWGGEESIDELLKSSFSLLRPTT
jgi:hypothetical protein